MNVFFPAMLLLAVILCAVLALAQPAPQGTLRLSLSGKSAVTIAVTGLLLLSMLLISANYPSPDVPAAGTITTQQQTDGEQPLYYVRVYNNVLALYRADESVPCEITDIRLASLREDDRQRMQEGFPLYSEQEVTEFLEDFGS